MWRKSALLNLLFVPTLAWGQVDIGAVYSIFDSQVSSDTGYQVKVGGSAYIWGSYENPRLKVLGQPMGNLNMSGYGVGFRHRWDKWEAFIEYGQFEPQLKVNDVVRDEVVGAQLQKDFGPAPLPFNMASYELDKGHGGRVGVGYLIRPKIKVTASYKALSVGENLDWWDSETFAEGCNCFWQERNRLDLSALEFGLVLTF